MTEENADVTCRENGFTGQRFIKSLPKTQSLRNYAIYPYRYRCNGDEGSLCDCEVIPQNCTSNRIATVQCLNEGMSEIMRNISTS